MFAELKPPRASPRVLMHADNVGIGTFGYLATFVCSKCGAQSELMECSTRADVKRGMPCPDCNKNEEVPNGGS
jgi:DNA-directed RNA polymerase subunit RPC12/RpoP